MTFDDARAVVQRFSIGWPLKIFKPVLRLRSGGYANSIPDSAWFIVQFEAPDRDTGETRTFYFESSFSLAAYAEDSFISWIEMQLQLWMKHEFDESVMLDGERYRDPHGSDPAAMRRRWAGYRTD